MAKINVEKAEGKLGILVVGVGGAVASTFIAGTLMARKGLGIPVGSITQLSTIKLSDGTTFTRLQHMPPFSHRKTSTA